MIMSRKLLLKIKIDFCQDNVQERKYLRNVSFLGFIIINFNFIYAKLILALFIGFFSLDLFIHIIDFYVQCCKLYCCIGKKKITYIKSKNDDI